jgi:ABC-type lipoprotein export system ATPase subunit
MSADLRFKHPFTCILSGSTGSNKSTFCIKLLQNLDTPCTEQNFDGGIVWCYIERTSVPSQQLASLKKNIKFHEGVPANFDNAQGRPTIIILDDLLNEVYSRDVSVLFTKGSHHRNICVILITQNLFHQGRNARHISLSAKYLVLLKNVRGKHQFTYLAGQGFPEESDGLYKAYLDPTQ